MKGAGGFCEMALAVKITATTRAFRQRNAKLSCTLKWGAGDARRRAFSSFLNRGRDMKLSKVILLCFWLLIPIATNAQSRSARCQVTASWHDPQQRLGSGVTQLGTFNPLVADVSTFRTFNAYNNLTVTVGVEYEVHSEARFSEVRLMITAPNKEAKNTFGLVESSEASTAFMKRWNLTVGKRIAVEGKEYTFKLRCWDNVKFPK